MIYFDNAATTNYKPQTVINAAVEAMTKLPFNPNRSGNKQSIELQQRLLDIRGKIARLVNCDSRRVVFTPGCTAALNTAIIGTARRGRVIVSVAEHNSVLRPLTALSRHGVDLDFVHPEEDGQVSVGQVERLVKPDTYMVCVGHVCNVNGQLHNLTELGKFCRERNILFVADCAQSAGYIDIDMARDNIDMVCFGAHKGLHGIQGAGALCLSERATPKPTVFGGTGTDSHLIAQPTNLPEGLEAGTLPCPALLAMGAAIDWHNANKNVNRANVTGAQGMLVEALSQIEGVTLYSGKNDSGIVAFNIGKADSNFVADTLADKYDIAVRGGLQCAPLMHKALGTFGQGVVRASVSCVTTRQECYQLLYAVDRTAKELRSGNM